jgi:hypothetical protein
MVRSVKLYKVPRELERADILDDSKLQEYQESIQHYNDKAKKTLNKFSSKNGELTGSNPFMLVHLANSGLLPEGTRRLATRQA